MLIKNKKKIPLYVSYLSIFVFLFFGFLSFSTERFSAYTILDSKDVSLFTQSKTSSFYLQKDFLWNLYRLKNNTQYTYEKSSIVMCTLSYL